MYINSLKSFNITLRDFTVISRHYRRLCQWNLFQPKSSKVKQSCRDDVIYQKPLSYNDSTTYSGMYSIGFDRSGRCPGPHLKEGGIKKVNALALPGMEREESEKN